MKKLFFCFAFFTTQFVNAAGDLTFDLTFSPPNSNSKVISFNNLNGKYDAPLRILPSTNLRYYLVGYHKSNEITNIKPEIIIQKFLNSGELDTSYGTNGTGIFRINTNYDQIVDAAIGPNENIYIAGSFSSISLDKDMAVTCINQAGQLCSGFGSAGTVGLPVNAGGANNDMPVRLIVLGQSIYLAATVDYSATDTAIAVLKLNAITGRAYSPIYLPAFGNYPTGFNYIALYHFGTKNVVKNLAGVSTPAGDCLYIVGNFLASPNNTNGFIMALDSNGQPSSDFSSDVAPATRQLEFSLGTNDMGDAFNEISAITVRANGNLLLAGSSSVDSTHDQLNLIEMYPNGQLVSSFPTQNVQWGDGMVRPVDIIERPGAGHIVVAAKIISSNPSSHFIQGVLQFTPTGGIMAVEDLDPLPVGPTFPESIPSALWVNAQNRILLAGKFMVEYSSNPDIEDDYDITLARFTADDSIFANGFAGKFKD